MCIKNNQKITIDDIMQGVENIKTDNGDLTPIVTKLHEVKNALLQCLDLLNELPVKGKDNLDVLLGCIFVVEELAGSRREENGR